MPHFLWAVRGAHFLRCSKSQHPYVSCLVTFPHGHQLLYQPNITEGQGPKQPATWISHLFATKVTCKAASRARSFIAWIRKISESTCTIRFSQTQPTQPTKSSKNCCHTQKWLIRVQGTQAAMKPIPLMRTVSFTFSSWGPEGGSNRSEGRKASKIQVVWYTLLLQRWKLVEIARLQHLQFLAYQALESSSNLSLSSGTTQ